MTPKKRRGRPKTLTSAQAKARRIANTAAWKKAKTKSVNLTLNAEKDADIIEWLEAHKPKQRYIRGLIRRDMDGGN